MEVAEEHVVAEQLTRESDEETRRSGQKAPQVFRRTLEVVDDEEGDVTRGELAQEAFPRQR